MANDSDIKTKVPEKLKREFNWIMVIILLHLNALSLVSLVYLPAALVRTWLFIIALVILGTLGITAGAHRLWAHHCYEATTGLKIFLMLCQTLIGQGSIYSWVLEHRIHHKYRKTNFDSFDANKGFLHSHFVHFLQKPHEHQEKLEMEIDMNDLEDDKVVMFQKKYYWLLWFVINILCMNAPAEYWGENLVASCILLFWFRYYIILNVAWLVHSATTVWSLNSDEKYPNDSNMIFFVKKTHWINYHYLAPWDYMCGEFGKYGTDCTTMFIRVCAVLGYASKLKTIDGKTMKEVIFKAVENNEPVTKALDDIQNSTVEKELYLSPLTVMM